MNVTRILTGGLALSMGTWLLAGCGSKTTEQAEEAPIKSVQQAKSEVPAGDADLLNNLPLGRGAGPQTEADKAWDEVMKAIQPSASTEEQTAPQTPEAL